jgi:hypothetical protein
VKAVETIKAHNCTCISSKEVSVLWALFLASARVSICLYCEEGHKGPFGVTAGLRTCLYRLCELRSSYFAERTAKVEFCASWHFVYMWSTAYVYIHVYTCMCIQGSLPCLGRTLVDVTSDTYIRR